MSRFSIRTAWWRKEWVAESHGNEMRNDSLSTPYQGKQGGRPDLPCAAPPLPPPRALPICVRPVEMPPPPCGRPRGRVYFIPAPRPAGPTGRAEAARANLENRILRSMRSTRQTSEVEVTKCAT